MSITTRLPPMDQALAEARAAAERGEVPIGAVIVGPDGTVLAAAGNRTEADSDPTAHAEMLAIRAAAAKLGSARLVDCDLHVTLEPCPMCAQAISFADRKSTRLNSSHANISYAVFCLKKKKKT